MGLFDAPPNKSLDASGVSGLVIDNLSLTLSPAASTRSFGVRLNMKSSLLLIFLLATCSDVLAQGRQFQMPAKPVNCESDIAILDDASNQAGDRDLIIVIARLVDGDQNRDLNRRRLHNVRTYLTQWDGRRNPANVITAQGDRVKRYGRVELYVAGKLHWVVLIWPNADLIVGSCTYEINSPDEQRRENIVPVARSFSTEVSWQAAVLARTPNKSLGRRQVSVLRQLVTRSLSLPVLTRC
jgi:hypothetical protein